MRTPDGQPLPERVDSLLATGRAHWQAGRRRAALAAADAAVALDPRSAGAHHLRAVALHELRRPAQARAAATEAVRLAPLDAVFRAHLGNTWLRKSPVVAAEHYLASLTFDPGQPITLNNLAVALMKLGRYDDAAAALKAALALDPAQPLAKANLVRLSNPLLRARWLGWTGLALAVPSCVLLARLALSGGKEGWAAWGAALPWLPWLVAFLLLQRAAMRRLEGEGMGTTPGRARLPP